MNELKERLRKYVDQEGSLITRSEIVDLIFNFIINHPKLILESNFKEEIKSLTEDSFHEGYKLGINQGEDYEVFEKYYENKEDYSANLNLANYFVDINKV